MQLFKQIHNIFPKKEIRGLKLGTSWVQEQSSPSAPPITSLKSKIPIRYVMLLAHWTLNRTLNRVRNREFFRYFSCK